MKHLKTDDQIGEEYGEAFAAQPPTKGPRVPKGQRFWQPKLGPVGTAILLNRTDKTKFAYGERGSVKTGTFVHDMIRHCYEDYQPGKMTPLVVMCTIVRASATEGGAWEKLHSLYLPEWRNGIGLDFSEPRMDDQRQRYCFVATKHGHWARIVLKSIPYGESIRGRLKGPEPSYFFFDELTETDSPDYYIVPVQSLRRPTGGPHFYGTAGNPPDLGTEHWTWKVLCQKEEGTGTDGKPIYKDPELPIGGGRLKGTPDGVAVYHVPLSDNVHWSDEEKRKYRSVLMAEARLDPTAEDRLIKGLWTARPTGQGLFKQWFVPSVHIKPPNGAVKRQGLLPLAGWPIYLGYDLGQVYSSVKFLQRIVLEQKPKPGQAPDPNAKRVIWTVFDEVDHLNERIIYRNLAKELIRRMRHWRALPLPSNNGQPFGFNYIHITDESAVNQWRPNGEGSFDAWEFEREFNKFCEADGLPKMKMIGCPKPAGSVAIRVALLQAKLFHEELFISAMCPNTIAMLRNLEAEKDDADKPKRTKWLHVFDAVTYPIFKTEISARAPGVTAAASTGSVGIIKCGSG